MQPLGITFDHVRRGRCNALTLSSAVLAILFAGGCAAPRPPTAQEQFAAWLSESPRTIAISVDPRLPDASLVSRDDHTGKRVGMGVVGGAVGAVRVIGDFCTAGFAGCLVGIVLSPLGAVVGAVVGASGVQSTYQSHAVEAAQGAPQMVTVNQVTDLPAMLAAAVSERRVRAHTLRPVQYAKESQPLGAAEGTLRLRFSDFRLLGDIGDDPQIALALRIASEVQTSTSAGVWGHYSYEGSSRRVSAWLADDARLFREEIKLAIQTLATNVVQDLGSPSSVAANSVKAQKEAMRSARAYRYPAGAYVPSREPYVPKLRELGKIDDGDVFPAGELYVDNDVISTGSGNDIQKWFVVKLPSPTPKGERSYAARAKVDCLTGVFSVEHSMTSATEYGSFPAITWQDHSPVLVVDKPSAPLASAVREICKQ